MEFIPEQGTHSHADSSTLILPALSIGNVGQLAVDLLVASSKADRVGFLDSPYVLPCVGNDAYGPVPQGQLALPLEAYESASNGIALIQQRSPAVKDPSPPLVAESKSLGGGPGVLSDLAVSLSNFFNGKRRANFDVAQNPVRRQISSPSIMFKSSRLLATFFPPQYYHINLSLVKNGLPTSHLSHHLSLLVH
ncbi:hypothetical protein ACLB2K_044610 [Fragaria x ananassa]